MDISQVKSPKHYTEGRKFEPKDVIRDWGLNFNMGSALKYIARAGRKGDPIEDLEKAREYLSFEVEALKAERGVKGNAQPTKPEERKEVKCGVIELKVPQGTPLEDVIQMAISQIMGVEEDDE